MTYRMIRYSPLLVVFLLCLYPSFAETPPSPFVNVRSAPENPIVELRDANQFLNFDLIVRNASGLTLRLSEIQLAVYDSTHSLVMMKSLNTDAFAPSIEVIGKQTMAPGEHLDVFNPFFRFDSGVPLAELRYSFCLLREENAHEIKLVVVDLSTSANVDLAGARMLVELEKHLTHAGISLKLAETHGDVRDVLQAQGLEERIEGAGERSDVESLIENWKVSTVSRLKP
jgi:anti-anti-sigma regulatory factor